MTATLKGLNDPTLTDSSILLDSETNSNLNSGVSRGRGRGRGKRGRGRGRPALSRTI